MTADTPSKHKFSVDCLLLMDQAGVFSSDQSVELLAGEIIDMSPIHAPHATAVRNLLRMFQQQLSTEDYLIDAQNPVQLSNDSLPQPDIIIAPFRKELLQLGHWQAHDIRLIVEVSDSTYRYDRNQKHRAYAEAAIPEYWIANLKKKQLEVYTTPSESGYDQEDIYSDGFITSLGFFLDVNRLLSFL